MEYIEKDHLPRVLRKLERQLQEIPLQVLRRPDTSGEQLRVFWQLNVFVYASVRQLRELMDSMLILVEAGKIPGTHFFIRALLEITAHVHHVQKHVRQHLENNDFKTLAAYLDKALSGSRYIQEFGSSFGSGFEDCVDYPESVHIARAIGALTEKFSDARQEYSYVSEKCHPSFVGLLQYFEMGPQVGGATFEVNTRRVGDAELSRVVVWLAFLLPELINLLVLTKETIVRTKLISVVESLVVLCKKESSI